MTYTDLTLEILSGLTLENLESLPIDDTPEPNGVTFYSVMLDDLFLSSLLTLDTLKLGKPPGVWHITPVSVVGVEAGDWNFAIREVHL